MRRIRAPRRNNAPCAGCVISEPDGVLNGNARLQGSISPVFMQYNKPFVSGLRTQ